MADGYVDLTEFIPAVGVRPGDFGLDEDAELTELLDRWSSYVKGEIDDHCNRDFLEQAGGVLADVHPTIRSVGERALSRWVQQVRSHRDAALVRLDDWQVGINLVDEVLPQHLRDTLDRHLRSLRKHLFSGFVSHG